MRAAAWLYCFVWTVTANVEKTIFVAPQPAQLPNDQWALDILHLGALSPAHASIPSVLETRLPVSHARPGAPRGGLPSWYLLRDLEEGRRYEVRVCWPATSPTDFWLEAFTPSQVLNTAELLASFSDYHSDRQSHLPKHIALSPLPSDAPPSVLLLRVQAAASYYSTNKTLMDYPPPVKVDIILDPFILNIFPHSLLPIATYITAVAIAAWFLSGAIYRWLLSVAAEPLPKTHDD